MAGDEEKKKKKKSKKTEKAAEEAPAVEEPPPPPPQEEAAPPPPAKGGDDEGGFDWTNQDDTAQDPEVAAEAPAAEEAPVEGGEAPLEGEGAELPPQPKKKPKFFVHWDRKKSRFYDYNFEYGANYYSSMINYVDAKNAGGASVPRRMAFAERGMYSSLAKSRAPDMKTQSLLNDVRSSIRNFESSQKVYAYGKK